jgi:hypothetical protein
MIFEAKYAGRCNACDDRIHEGERVMYDDDQIVHAQCDPTGLDDDPATACTQCWLIHAGECL